MLKRNKVNQKNSAWSAFFLHSPISLFTSHFVFTWNSCFLFLSFLCRCNKELLECHELSGLLIFFSLICKESKGNKIVVEKQPELSVGALRSQQFLLENICWSVLLLLTLSLHFRKQSSLIFVFVRKQSVISLKSPSRSSATSPDVCRSVYILTFSHHAAFACSYETWQSLPHLTDSLLCVGFLKALCRLRFLSTLFIRALFILWQIKVVNQ